MARLVYQEKPELNHPSMVVGFAGWIDGGKAATGTLRYLIRKLPATKFAEIPVADYLVVQLPGIESVRPHSKTEDGLVQEVSYPSNEFFYWKAPPPGRDLILLLGTEPHLRWKDYMGDIMAVVEEFQVRRLYSVGAVLGGVPHTREPAVSCAVSHPELKEELRRYAVRFSNYEGPATFNTALLWECRERGVQAVHMSGRAAYYPEFGIVIAYNPMVIQAVLKRLRGLLKMDLDLSDLEKAGQELSDRLSDLAEQSLQFKQHLVELERNFVEMRYDPPLEAAPEELVRGAEEFLRRRHQGDSPS